MDENRPTAPDPTPDRAYLSVTRLPDGRYCVAYTTSRVRRLSYTPSAEQVVRQAQCAGDIPISTDDAALRQCCQDVDLPLM